MSGVVTVGVAVTAIATAVATDFATFAVIAAVGATVGAIGTIAKVPALQIAGAAIGVVGAVGGLASAAGAFGAGGVFGTGGTVAGAFGGASAASPVGGFSESAAQIGATQAAGADNLAGLGSAGGAAPSWADNAWAGRGVIDQVTGGMSTAAAASSPQIASASAPGVPAADGGPTGVSAAGEAGDTITPAASNQGITKDILAGGTGAPAAPQAGVPLASTGPASVTGQPDFTGFGSGSTGTMNMATSGSSSTWGDIGNFLKENKTLVSGVIQAGASFLSGATSPLLPAQVNTLNEQAKANAAAANRSNAEAAILDMRASNMGQPIPVASRVTGRPALGLVNQAVPITGVPA